ncbi:hypothetical protein [Finegoldia magna]|uniref:Uncharacterized protein n=1 Tax=Finegoldia magna TaxID=1260 RepID=A0A233VMA4_FINMA|nr:hypothetical protein [Finegoldia magna]OXZ33481.1 hypothetical protein B9N55_03675 [Finegoldia magna]
MKIELSEKLKEYCNQKSKHKILLYMGQSPCCTIGEAKYYAKFILKSPHLKEVNIDGISVYYEAYIEKYLEDCQLDLVKFLNMIIVDY